MGNPAKSTDDSVSIKPLHPPAKRSGDPKKKTVKSEVKNDNYSVQNQCTLCFTTFKNPSSLRTHQYVCGENPNKKTFQCPKCEKTFNRKNRWVEHVSAVKCHFTKSFKKCTYPDCEFTYVYKTALASHLRNFHKCDIKPEQFYDFNSWADFLKWKDEEEIRTFSYYSQHSGEANKTVHFYCQRDGSDKRHSKVHAPATDSKDESCIDDELLSSTTPSDSQSIQSSVGVYEETVSYSEKKKNCRKSPNIKGRIKLGKVCISMIKAKKQDDGSVRITYYPTHSHPLDVNDLQHQPLKASEEFIKHHLSLGFGQRRIRNILREEKFSRANRSLLQPAKLTRIDFINLKSIREQKMLQLKIADSNSFDDATSTRLLVEKLRNEPYDPILIYKPAGNNLIVGPDSAHQLSEDTFMIGVQTQDQLDLMKTSSCEILIIDAIHDATQYGCQLVNVSGVDELNRGYPLGHCLTDRIDHNLQHFFSAILQRLPDMKVNCIITDDDSTLINAAKKGFDDYNIKHILCLRKFKRTLRRQLQVKVRDNALETQVFKILCTAIDVNNEEEFNQLISVLHQKYDNCSALSTFMKYFTAYCMPKVKKWAMCYRKFPHRYVETVVFVESFNNILKSACLKHRPDKRVDTLLNLLLIIEDDYYFRRIRNVILSPQTKKTYVKTLSLLHEKSLAIPDSSVVEVIEDYNWEVISEDNKDAVYEVLRISYECTRPSMCLFQCNSSVCQNLCTHLYVCTCPHDDPICNHVHKVHSVILKQFNNVIISNPYQPEITFYQFSDDNREDNSVEIEDNKVEPSEPCSEKELLQLISELTEHVKSPAVKQTLHPHLIGAIRQLVTECIAVETLSNQGYDTTVATVTTTEDDSASSEKITCRLVPFKKGNEIDSPATIKKQEICSKILENNDFKEAISYNRNTFDMLTTGQVVTIQIPPNSDHTYTDFDIDIQLNQEVVTQPMEY